MPESNQQNFEVPQESVVPPSPVTKRNKLVIVLIPTAVFLVILSIVTSILVASRKKGATSISASPTPVVVEVTPTPELTIATTSAFFPFVASISAINRDLNAVDLKGLDISVPQLDLHVSFERPQ